MKTGIQKVFFGSNLKFLRERKRMGQEALAQKLLITRAKLVAIETGQTKSPQPEDYINVSEYFKISIDNLLKIDLSKLSELKLRELEAGNDIYMNGGSIRVLAITVNKDNQENVEYVPIKAKAGYMAGYNDPEFIATLPKYSLPNLPEGNTYRIFPTVGDSMLPIPEGSEITGSFVQDWKSIKPGTLCIIILKNEQDLVFKQVTIADNMLLLESLNRNYTPYQVPTSEILEIWKFHSYRTEKIPEVELDMQAMALALREVKQELGKLSGKKLDP